MQIRSLLLWLSLVGLTQCIAQEPMVIVRFNNQEGRPIYGLSPSDLKNDLDKSFAQVIQTKLGGGTNSKLEVTLQARIPYPQAPDSIVWSIEFSIMDGLIRRQSTRCQGVTNGHAGFPFAVRARAISGVGALLQNSIGQIPNQLQDLVRPQATELDSQISPSKLVKLSRDARTIGVVKAEVLFDELGKVVEVPYLEGPNLFRAQVREQLLASKFHPIGTGLHLAVVRFQIHPFEERGLECFDGSIDIHAIGGIE